MENYVTIAKFENIFEADLARSLWKTTALT